MDWILFSQAPCHHHLDSHQHFCYPSSLLPNGTLPPLPNLRMLSLLRLAVDWLLVFDLCRALELSLLLDLPASSLVYRVLCWWLCLPSFREILSPTSLGCGHLCRSMHCQLRRDEWVCSYSDCCCDHDRLPPSHIYQKSKRFPEEDSILTSPHRMRVWPAGDEGCTDGFATNNYSE
jgi:hypothetical protein